MRPLDLARRWHREGFVTDAGLHELEQRHGRDDPGHLATVLLAGAGAVLAAAIIAVAVLGNFSEQSTRLYFLGTGGLVGVAAVVAWHLSAWKEAAEAGAITAAALLVPGAMFFLFDSTNTSLYAWLVAALGAACLALPSRTVLVPTAGAVALHVLVASASQDLWGAEGTWVWLAVATGLTFVAFISARLDVWNDRHVLLNLAAPIILAIATTVWWFEIAERSVRFAGAPELAVAALQVPILALAFRQKLRPILIGSVGVIAVDAIVFGFDIGELALGIPMLLLVSGALVALAMWSRQADAGQD